MSIHLQNSAEISHILGIDFGKSKIGLALADSETRIAFVYATIVNDKYLADNLRKIMEKENIKTVIVGRSEYVYNSNGKEKQLVEILQKLNVAVEFQEEMFTTKMAQANLKEKGERKVGQKDDSESAKIILQSWLDR